MVQIKATQGKNIGLSSEPDNLIVLKILKDGRTDEIYNGPGKLVWESCGRMKKNGHRPITVSKLKSIMAGVPISNRLEKFND